MTQTAGFTTITWNGVDITTSVDKFTPPIVADMTDLSTLPSGGAWGAMQMKRGAISSQVSIDVLINSTIWGLLQQMDGLRTGALLQAKTGINAAPQQGDVLFQGTYSLIKVSTKNTSGQARKATLSLEPTDGGAVAPQLTRI